MATTLLTEEEYKHIREQHDSLLQRIPTASPRAATIYASGAKLYANFLAKEDAKRASSQAKATSRESILKAKEARRNGNASQTQGTPRVETPKTKTP